METKNKNEVNIAKFLRSAPRSLEIKLYSPLIGSCTLDRIDDDYLWVKSKDGHAYTFRHSGNYFKGIGECLLFPKDGETWEHWQKIYFYEGCFIKNETTGEVFLYMGDGSLQDDKANVIENASLDDYLFARGSEISSFLNRLLDNGYRYLSQTKKVVPLLPDDYKAFFDTGTIKLNAKHTKESCEYVLTNEVYMAARKLLDALTNK